MIIADLASWEPFEFGWHGLDLRLVGAGLTSSFVLTSPSAGKDLLFRQIQWMRLAAIFFPP